DVRRRRPGGDYMHGSSAIEDDTSEDFDARTMVQAEVPAQVCEVTRQRLNGHDTCPKLRRQKRIEADIGAEVVEDATRPGEAPDCRLLARLIDAQPTAVGMGTD